MSKPIAIKIEGDPLLSKVWCVTTWCVVDAYKCLLIVYYMHFKLLFYLTSDVICTAVMAKIAMKTSYLRMIFIHIGFPESQCFCSTFTIESSAIMASYYLMCA